MAQSRLALLLLPAPPEPLTAASLSAAYRPSITAAVTALKCSARGHQLQVVVPHPTAGSYEATQKLVGGLYRLSSIVCALLDVDVDPDVPSSVDIRIILLDYRSTQKSDKELLLDPSRAGPIIDLQTFAAARRNWSYVFSVEGERGQQLLADYTSLASQRSPPFTGQVKLVSGGLSLVTSGAGQVNEAVFTPSNHHIVAVGGTFDHLHAGHKLLLTATALLLHSTERSRLFQRRLIIGITGDELLKNKKHAEYLKSWKKRQDDVVDFLLSILLFSEGNQEQNLKIRQLDDHGPNGVAVHTTLVASSITIECVEIQDPFGPTITEEDITALVVSGETRSGGQLVNEKRTEKGWKALEVFEVDVLDADEGEDEENPNKPENFASKISSTEIRRRKAEIARTSSLS